MVYEELRNLARARTVEVYDLASRKRTAELRGHSALVSRVELNPRDAATAEYNVARLRARGQEFTGTAEALRWAERVLTGSGDIAPESGVTRSDTPSGADPESIRAWGASRRGSGTPS